MDLSPYVESLRRDLLAAAAAGTEETRRTAELLAATLEPAVRLSIMDVLSAATADVTASLDGVIVDVRLHGREPRITVETVEPEAEEAPAAPPPAAEPDADAGTARVTLRVPETLKTRVEEAAGRAGVSLNSWLVRAVTQALDGPPPANPGRPGRRLTGYARG
jgi:hypothetical protein